MALERILQKNKIKTTLISVGAWEFQIGHWKCLLEVLEVWESMSVRGVLGSILFFFWGGWGVESGPQGTHRSESIKTPLLHRAFLNIMLKCNNTSPERPRSERAKSTL